MFIDYLLVYMYNFTKLNKLKSNNTSYAFDRKISIIINCYLFCKTAIKIPNVKKNKTDAASTK